MFADFLRGVSYVPLAFHRLTEPGLRRYVWLPVVINAVVFIGLFWLGYDWFRALMTAFLPSAQAIDPAAWQGSWWREVVGWLLGLLEGVLVVLQWLILPLYLLASAVIAFFTFTAVANLIASPFNGMLSAQVERRRTGRMPPDVPEGAGVLVSAMGAVVDELRKIAYFALLALPLLVAMFVPVINLATPALWALYGAWVLALEYSDFPLGNHGHTFRVQRRIVRERRFLHLGLGSAVLALTIIPGLNLVAMPTGVIAATMLRADLSGSDQTPSVRR